MAEQYDNLAIPCGCDPFPDQKDSEMCGPCQPNMIITCEEEAILGKLRDIKTQIRPITERMKEIRAYEAAELSAGLVSEDKTEWKELTSLLEKYRGQWSEWQTRLDAATETKLILLGHRDAI